MTFEEYEQFYMLADELVHYLEGIVEVEGTNQNLSSHQVLSLIFFAEQFNIFSNQFWALTHEGLNQNIDNFAPGELL